MSSIPFVRRGAENHFLLSTLSKDSDKLIEINDTSSVGRYLVILPVLDYVRLQHQEDRGRLGLLTQDDVASIKQGRALLILDMSNEGPTYDAEIFGALHKNLSDLGIPQSHVVFVSQNRLLPVEYRRHHRDGIVFWQSEFFVQTIAHWMSETESLRLFGDKAFERGSYSPLRSHDAEPSFLCQNAAVRWHRVLTYRWLTLNGMSSQGIVSFYGIGKDNSKASEIDISNPPKDIRGAFPELVAGIENWIPRRAEKVDMSVGSGNDLVLTLDTASYAKVDLVIVTESDFFTAGIDRVTEKAIKAAAMGVPFIIIGAPGSVRRLSEMGFCTFDGLIDQTYDLIIDPTERLQRLFETITSSWQRCRASPARWRSAAREDALANFNHGKDGLVGRLNRILSGPIISKMGSFIECASVIA